MNLEEILKDHIETIVSNEDAKNQIAPLSGSNALLFDGINFEAESPDHCPRTALLRRVAGIQQKRQAQSFISNTHGRLFETFFKDLLKNGFSMDWKEEEEAEVTLEDDQGNILLTARPDIVLKYENKLYPIEIKTIQSNNTAYSVCIKGKPKLGAAIQLAIYMYGHNTEQGFLLYAITNWFGGFAGKTKWKVEPSLKIFPCQLTDGNLYYSIDNNKSVVSIEKLIKGSYEFLICKDKNILPSRPHWVDINGDIAKYDGCSLCPCNSVCDKFDAQNNKNLSEFFNAVKEVI